MLHINVKLEKRHRNTPPEIYKITINYLTRREVTGFRGGGGEGWGGRRFLVKVTRERTLRFKLGKLLPYLTMN